MKLLITLSILAVAFAGVDDGPQKNKSTAVKAGNMSSRPVSKQRSETDKKTGGVEKGKRSGGVEKG